MSDGAPGPAPGITVRSLGWLFLGLVVVAIIIQFFGAIDAPAGGAAGVDAIPLPVLMVFAVAVGAAMILRKATGLGWLTRAEQVFVLYTLLLAAPLMTSGFWRFFLKANANVARYGSAEFYDATSRKSWPHGPNLLGAVFAHPGGSADPGVSFLGTVERASFRPGVDVPGHGFNLRNEGEGVSSVRFVVPVRHEGRVQMPLDQPYLFTALLRPGELGPRSTYFVRLIPAEDADPVELLRSRAAGRVSPLQPEGFLRVLRYGVKLPASAVDDRITLEVGLEGPGRLELADAEWLNVFAVEAAYTGRAGVSPEEYAALPEAARGAVVVLPETMWSLAGLKTALTGYVPWAEWREPLIFWAGYLGLVFLASLGFACLIRRQWMQSERFPAPLIAPTVALVEGGSFWHGGSSWLRRPAFWVGFGIVGVWAGLLAWSSLNPSVPAPTIAVPLRGYFTSPAWMQAMDITLTARPLIFALALFVDLNVLASLVAGFFLFRAQFLVGEATGLSADKRFPYGSTQIAGSTLAYALVIVWLARRYLARFLRDALTGAPRPDEYLSPRAATGLIVLSFAGVAGWAVWAQMPVIPILVIFGIMFAFSVVVMRFRTELGVSDYGILAHNLQGIRGGIMSLLLVLLGSYSAFGAEGMVFAAFLAMFFFSYQSLFWIVPGLQLEMLEVGRRAGVKPGHVLTGALLGLVGGLVVGGVVYLSSAYAIGADNYPIPGHYGEERGPFAVATSQAADSANDGTHGGVINAWMSPEGVAVAFGAVGTLVVSALRQVFAGFWFHPAGFILAPSALILEAWGSLLLALLVRFLVLRLGGAAAVRERLFPFAAGAVLAIAAVTALFWAVQTYQFFFDPTTVKANLDL